MPTLEFTMGALWVRPLRDYLRRAKFHDPSIEWIETGGWLSKTFSVRASQSVLECIIRDYQKWLKATSPDS